MVSQVFHTLTSVRLHYAVPFNSVKYVHNSKVLILFQLTEMLQPKHARNLRVHVVLVITVLLLQFKK